ILVTLVAQGFTLPYCIKRSRLFDVSDNHGAEEEMKQRMKRGLKEHIYRFLKNKYDHNIITELGMEKFLKQWEERSKATDEVLMNEKTKAIFIEVLNVQRQYLTELNKDPKFDEELIRQQLYQIDLEEERLKVI
ncbi:MAG: Na+/H+ antiporter, partial [Terrimonas sp.]|nr:Na+/H+ antiporter [Terrimonas sp.]